MGSLVAYAVYRLVPWRSAIASARRMVAAGTGGLHRHQRGGAVRRHRIRHPAAAVSDASGAPLYAPYPLHIAIPAMMLGHLTLAGLAELVISSGMVGLPTAHRSGIAATDRARRAGGQRVEASRRASGAAAHRAQTMAGAGSAAGSDAARNPGGGQRVGRMERAAISPIRRPPPDRRAPRTIRRRRPQRPRGLERLSAIWTAPVSRYAPSFIRSAPFGYVVSAMVGVGLIVALALS